MKVCRASKRRALQQPRYRLSFEPDHDHPAWLEATAALSPAEVPDAFYVVRTAVNEPKSMPSTRLAPHSTLSLTALRKRLYRAGVRKGRIAALAREIHAGPGATENASFGGRMVLRWQVSELESRFGHRVARAVRRFVRERWVMLDEAWALFAAEGAAEVIQLAMRRSRKYNAAPLLVEQALP